MYFRRGSDSFLQPRQSMFSFAAAIRALCRRHPTLLTRQSARADRRLKRAATVEAMEQRVLLSAAPPGVQFSADAIYADSGNPGAYIFDLSGGTATFDTDLSKGSPDWQTPPCNSPTALKPSSTRRKHLAACSSPAPPSSSPAPAAEAPTGTSSTSAWADFPWPRLPRSISPTTT